MSKVGHAKTVDEVKSLVASVVEHTKFRQLAVYSIDTFTKVLAPPNTFWREYIDVAIEIDAASAVIKVIRKHPGNEMVLTAATKCLMRLAIDSTNAKIIGEEGGVDAVLESMASNDDLDSDVLLTSLKLIDRMCNHPKSLEKIVTTEMVANISKVMQNNVAQNEVVGLCARILEKMTRTQHGVEAAKSAEDESAQISDALLARLKAATKEDITNNKMNTNNAPSCTAVCKVLSRLVQVEPSLSEKVQKEFDTLLELAAKYSDDEQLVRVISRLVTKTMDGGIADIIQKLQQQQNQQAGDDDTQKERLLALLSTLAVDGEMSEEIASNGGVSALVGALETQLSDRAKEELVRTIARLATSAKSLDELLAGGALEQLIAVLKDENSPDDLKALILQAINKICNQARSALSTLLEKAPQAVPAVVKALEVSNSPQVAERGMQFIDALCRDSEIPKDTVKLATTIIQEAQKFTNDNIVQKAACRSLRNLARTQKEKLPAGIIDTISLPNLDASHKPTDLMKEAVFLTQALDAPEERATKKNELFEALVGAVCAAPEDTDLRRAAIDIVADFCHEDQFVLDTVAHLQEFAIKIEQNQLSDHEFHSVPIVAMKLGVLAMVPANGPKLIAADAARPLVAVMAAIAPNLQSPDTPQLDDLVRTFANALIEMLPSRFLTITETKQDEIETKKLKVFPLEAAAKAAIAVIKHGADQAQCAGPALDLLEGVAHCVQDPTSPDLVKLGAVEACSKSIIAAHEGDLAILEPVCHTLDAIAALDIDGVADHNGQKACLAALTAMTNAKIAQSGDDEAEDLTIGQIPQEVPARKRRSSALSNLHAANPETSITQPHHSNVDRATVSALKTIERVASSTPERSKLTAKQGGVDTVFSAMDAATTPEVVSQSESTLKSLVSETEARKLLQKLKAVPLDKISQGEPTTMRQAAGLVSKLGLLMACGKQMAEPIQADGGPETLAAIMQAAVIAPDTRAILKTKANLVRSCVQALGRIATRGLVIPNAIDLVPALVAELKNNPSIDVVNALAAMVEDPQVCQALVDQGCIEALIPLLEVDALREPVFHCLQALARNDPEHAAKRIVDCGALPLVCQYVSDELAGAASAKTPRADAVGPAVALLAALADNADADMLLDAGTLRLVEQILDSVGDEITRSRSCKANKEIAAVSGLIKGLAKKSPELCGQMVQGSARKLTSLVSAIASVDDAQLGSLDVTLDDLAELMDDLAQTDEQSAQSLKDAGASDALIGAMNALPNNVGVAAKCATALGKISGSGIGGLEPLLQKCNDLADSSLTMIDDQPTLNSTLMDLANNVKLASNLVLQPGVLSDQPAVEKAAMIARHILDDLYKLPQLKESPLNNAVANTLALLSRLNNVPDLEAPDFDLTLDCLDGAFAMDDQLQAAACASLASLCVKGGPAVVRSVAARGMLAKVQAAADSGLGRLGPNELQSEAASALDAVLEQGISNAAILAADPDGAGALAKLLATLAVASDPNALGQAIDKVLDPMALLEALTHLNYENNFEGPGNARAAGAICEKLCDCAAENPDAVIPYKIEHVSALCKGKKGLKPLAENVMRLHNPTLATPQGAALCFGDYDPDFNDLVAEDICGNETNADRANAAAGLLATALPHGDPTCTAGLLNSKLPKALVNAMRSSPLDLKFDPGFIQNDLYDLNALAETAGIEPMDLPKDTIRVVSDAMRAHPDSEYIQATGQALIDKLKAAQNAGGPEEALKQKLGDLEGFHAAAADWQMIASSDGNYYYNAATGESTWDQPDDHLAFMDELDDLAALVDDLQDDLSSITPEATKGLIGALGTHARDPGVCGRAAKILNALGKDPSALDDLADLGSLEMLIPALEHCGGDADLVNDATELLSNLSKLDKMKAKLSLREYVRVLNQTSLDHMGTSAVVNRCVTILANLAFNNAEVIGYEYEFNVPYTLKWALQSHLAEEETCESCVYAATCLLTDDEPRKKYVCEQLTPEFVECLNLYATQNSFFAKCARCMGSMSIVDECVITMTSAGVVPLIVGGIDVHLDDPKTLKIAVELLSNFGATEDEEHDQAATEALVEGGAIQAIRRVLDEHTNAKQVPLLTACFDALYNVGNDEEAARVITDEGLCESTVDCLEQFDFDVHLLRQCVKLISVLTYNDFSVDRLTSIHATPALLDALSAHADDEEFVIDDVLALSNLVTVPKVARIFLEKSYLKDMLELFDVYDNHAEVVKFILITLIRLAADDDLSQKIARDGMPYIMRATSNFIEDAEVLSLIFELLGQLAYVKQNLRALVGAGGIKVLLDTLDTFDDSPELIIKTVNTLDNLVSADVEYASVVLERDGEGLLKQCQTKWQNDAGVTRAVDAALLSIHAMIAQKEKQRTNRAALFARLGEDEMDVNKLKTQKLKNRAEDEEPVDDPIKKYRDMLVSGIVLSQWDKGKSINRKLCINADWNAILTRDTQRGSAIQARFPLKSIRDVVPGYGAGHQVKSMMSKKTKPTAKEETCFILKGLKDDELICLATKNAQEATRIIDALQITLNCFSKWPHRLVNG